MSHRDGRIMTSPVTCAYGCSWKEANRRKEYRAEASYEYKKMTDEEQQYIAELLRADLEKILFEMIDQTKE